MPGLRPTLRFEKSLREVDTITRKRAAKALGLFIEDARHPSLNFEKMRASGFATIRVDQKWRIILNDAGNDMYDVIDILDHDKTMSRYGRGR